LGVATAKINRSTPHCCPQCLAPLPKSGVSGQILFSAPMEDVGWYDGFLAIGNVSLPSSSGGTVAAITARGEDKTIRQYPGSIRRAIQVCTQAL
jgi:hypothetical protein